MDPDPEILTMESFAPHAGSVFRVKAGEIELEFKLEGIKDQSHLRGEGPDGKPIGTRDPFTLTLTGPKEVLLAQHMYSVTHPEMGTLILFIKPFHESPDAYYYEVIFN